ncbi:hypothetical protein ACFQBQ_05630 [Granulicella cerasi]|uniref:Uncharacterized protein n=1 Tax=Granulicella cerasi TaxID=741063 RepID=A0ABW1Z7C3_9BACT|nr:hypothetical protein [Granulicella cerasi]
MAATQFVQEEKSSPLKPVLIAVVALALAAVAVFALYPKRSSQLTVTHAEVFAPHTQTKDTAQSSNVKVLDAPPAVEDDVYVATTLKLDNKLHVPMYFSGVTATATLADGQQVDATVVHSDSDLRNVQLSFPQLHAMLPHPLHDSDEAPAGGALDGQVLLLFGNITGEQWKAKRSASLTLNLMHQDPMTVALP